MSPGTRLRYFATTLGVLVLDFVTKRIVLGNRETFSEGIVLIENFLQFTYVRNSGAAFGMFQGARWPFVAVSSLAVIGFTWILLVGRRGGLRAYAYAIILAGAIGNLIDRIFYDGRVVDFILMSWYDKGFPVYNVADMGVSIGAAFLIISMLREESTPSGEVSHESIEGNPEPGSAVDAGTGPRA